MEILKINMPISIEKLLLGSAIEGSYQENQRKRNKNYPKKTEQIIYYWEPEFKYQKEVQEV